MRSSHQEWADSWREHADAIRSEGDTEWANHCDWHADNNQRAADRESK